MSKFVTALAALCVLALPVLAQGEDETLTPEEAEAAYRAYAEEVLADVTPDHGIIALERSPVTLSVSDDYDFYSASESRTILEDLWGNPEDTNVLGMIFPAGLSPVDASWGAVLTYEDTGYVTDDDAASTDYAQLLNDMQSGTRESNAARVRQGFEEVQLVGWAVPPSYDAESHRLIWAKDLLFASSDGTHTLNYDMRLLGRHGVLSVNMVAAMDALSDVRSAGPDVLALASFNPGATYADYVKGDKTAGYGVAALIAGGAGVAVLKKTGLLVILFAFLKKGFILIPVLLAGVWRVIRGLFGGKASS
ncbi:DUF2167 domain-containing protein [Hyphomonas sp.]|uniref:DUF2167 domain-containing protein n=1 Tax=Hyphomonas sp. TaxID=87 RepID=UPI0025B8F1A5|nr:DUF2167 domain-containing protein [Hyphomonas sp.]MBI1400099.1 DUF2167 domain-containing protein [Hyphomonas sp.]